MYAELTGVVTLIATTDEMAAAYEILIETTLGHTVEPTVGLMNGQRVYAYSVNSLPATYWETAAGLLEKGLGAGEITPGVCKAVALLVCPTQVEVTAPPSKPKKVKVSRVAKSPAAPESATIALANGGNTADPAAPWGRRKDGTPRAKPGRKASD